MKIYFIPALVCAGLLAGCEKPEPTTYTIPKEVRGSGTMSGEAAPTPAPAPQRMEVLPGMKEAAQAAPELTYTVPEGWEEFPPQSVRKANFRVSDASGQAEIAVTVFPGDVGGTLANVNRWRGQVGLDPLTEEGLNTVTREIVISAHGGLLVDLPGPEQSILGGILRFHGDTWFFKMQGPKATVAAQASAMETFLGSVQIEDQHH